MLTERPTRVLVIDLVVSFRPESARLIVIIRHAFAMSPGLFGRASASAWFAGVPHSTWVGFPRSMIYQRPRWLGGQRQLTSDHRNRLDIWLLDCDWNWKNIVSHCKCNASLVFRIWCWWMVHSPTIWDAGRSLWHKTQNNVQNRNHHDCVAWINSHCLFVCCLVFYSMLGAHNLDNILPWMLAFVRPILELLTINVVGGVCAML